MNLTCKKPPLQPGDTYMALPGGDLRSRIVAATTPERPLDRLQIAANLHGSPVVLRFVALHPCGASEFVVTGLLLHDLPNMPVVMWECDDAADGEDAP